MASHEQPPYRPVERSRILSYLILILLAALIAWWYEPSWRARLDPNAVPRAITPRDDLTGLEKLNIEIYNRTLPSVVNITTLANREDVFGGDPQQVPAGTGSGFIWDTDGRIVTNYHVIQKADAATVTLADRTSYEAKLVGKYPDKDIAVLQIPAPRNKLVPIPIGRSNDLQVGQRVYVIGNPFGLDGTFTDGIISSLGRQIEAVTHRLIRDVIQTNAAINPGNSGGPLLDSAGRLIGVTTAIASPSGASAGVGFAIPVDEVNRIVPQLIQHGEVTQPGLGADLSPDDWNRSLHLEGVMIMRITPNGAAAKAGLKGARRTPRGIVPGDIILAIDGKPVHSSEDIYSLLEKHAIGDTVKLKIQRADQMMDVEVTLGVSK